ncbi:MAG: Radical domain protein [Chthonomonadaceae bacterium]|nr:Radical domain protein [Chthonomonadaceae bacterium]
MDVVFAVLPFADIGRPSIGVSLLQAEIAGEGFDSRVCYFNIEMAELLGLDLYRHLANSFPADSLIGEWIFADLLFGEELPAEREYIHRLVTKYPLYSGMASSLSDVRRRVPQFVEECVRQIQEIQPRVVGFTTTYHQTCACLAVARRLKEMPDAPWIVFGGANCEGEMGMQMARSFPWIDYVCTQEGDVVFPALLKTLLRDPVPQPVPGFAERERNAEIARPDLVQNMDVLPTPAYADYFERLNRSPLRPDIPTGLLLETSRGCWWGAKQHCTFCGLNGASMAYRSKSPDRAFEEISELQQTYGLNRIDCVDNILDVKYIQTLFPRIAESALDVELFYETKANLRHAQLVALRAGGVKAIQPGIESLSNAVLRLMRKGCTGTQNIQLLRWCDELGIVAAWNIITGFPGEAPEDYACMAQLVPLLVHLYAPAGCGPFRLDRFSPFYDHAGDYGLTHVRPNAAYYHVFPFGRRELARLAYFFEYDYPFDPEPAEYTADLTREVSVWRNLRAAAPEACPRLDLTQSESGVVITDTRPCAIQQTHTLSGLAARIYLFCDVAQTQNALTREFRDHADTTDIQETLESLIAAKLMIEMESQHLSLAILRDRIATQGAEERHATLHLEEAQTARPLLRTR